MKIAVLTTQTPHHAKFIMDIVNDYPDLICVLETTSVKPPFDTAHPFEALRDEYETSLFFDGQKSKRIENIALTQSVENINHTDALSFLIQQSPDIVIDFGTRKVGNHIISTFSGRIVNLHGGNPEEYRGLDSHLWAVYHNDFAGLVTCLHSMNEALDDGDIINLAAVDVDGVDELYKLRAANTMCCTQLCREYLEKMDKGQEIAVRSQKKKGRYYSFMPAALKESAVQKFSRRAGRGI